MTRLIFRRTPFEGDPQQVQIGDAVSYREGGKFMTGKVEEVHLPEKFLLLASVQYGGKVLRPPRKLKLAEVLKIERKDDPADISGPGNTVEHPAHDLPQQ
jgi:hypothetical protein